MPMGQPPLNKPLNKKLRLGRIEFLNVLPLYYPLEAGMTPHDFEVIQGPPAMLNELAARGELDISVVSSIEYARNAERYFLLPDLSISCNGPVGSVIFLSREPIENLAGKKIMLTTQSHTSVALLRMLFLLRFGIEVEFESGSASAALARGELPLALLTIGDEALRLRTHESYPYRMDLGEAWRSWTGLPFVFATWVIQRKSVEEWNGHLESAINSLFLAKKWGCSHIDVICREAAKRGPLDYDQLQEYYRGLGYNLDAGEQAGLRLFFSRLVEIGEIREIPSMEIYSPLRSVA